MKIKSHQKYNGRFWPEAIILYRSLTQEESELGPTYHLDGSTNRCSGKEIKLLLSAVRATTDGFLAVDLTCQSHGRGATAGITSVSRALQS